MWWCVAIVSVGERVRASERKLFVVSSNKVLPWNVSKWSPREERQSQRGVPFLSLRFSYHILPLLFSFLRRKFLSSSSSSPPPIFTTSFVVACATARDFPRKSRENYVTSDGFGRNWDKVQCTLALRFTTRCFYAVIFPGLGNTRTVAPCSLEYPRSYI